MYSVVIENIVTFERLKLLLLLIDFNIETLFNNAIFQRNNEFKTLTHISDHLFDKNRLIERSGVFIK